MHSPSIHVMKGAESIISLKGKTAGVLLLHGFLGNPSEMKYIGAKIYQAGYSISIPRYPGHGTSIHEMTGTYGRDWYMAAREAYLELAAHCERITIVGHSMGGIFAALIASEFSPEKICLISVPVKIKGWTIYLSPCIGLIKKIIPISDEKHGINRPETRAAHVSYSEQIPVKQAWELHKLIKRAMKILPEVTAPVLIMQSAGDDVIPEDSADYIYSRIGSVKKEKILFNKSNHVISVDYDRDAAAEAIIQFLSS